MNWFILIAGILYLGGSGLYLMREQYSLCLIFVCYAVANFLLARLG